MTNPRLAVLVTPVDAALLFPFYADVNINNAKFQWYQTGKRDQPSQSFYEVRGAACRFSVPLLSVHSIIHHPSSIIHHPSSIIHRAYPLAVACCSAHS